jgi:GT2 family glycosyltransferase
MTDENKKIRFLEKELLSIRQQNADLRKELFQIQRYFIFKERKSIEYIYHLGQFRSGISVKISNWIDNILRTFSLQNKKNAQKVSPQEELNYAEWIKLYDELSDEDRKNISQHISRFSCKLKFTFIVIYHDNCFDKLKLTLVSLFAQIYANSEIIIVGNANELKERSRDLISDYKLYDTIKFSFMSARDIGSDWLTAIKSEITGDFVAIIESGDMLSDDAVYTFASKLDLYPETQCIYCDEDLLNVFGDRISPFFKPDWNLELFLGQNYIGGLCFINRDLYLSSLKRLRNNMSPEALYFFAITSAKRDNIYHIPAPLFHRDGSRFDNSKLTWTHRSLDLIQIYNEQNSPGVFSKQMNFNPNWVETCYPIPNPEPLVTIIIPTHNRPDLIGTCLEGVLNKTNYRNVEIIIVDHENDLPEVNKLFKKYGSNHLVTILPYHGAFDHSRMNNKAAEIARGEVLLFLNDDIEIIDPNWLHEIVSHCLRKEIGVVGARLLYPSGKIQHAGIILGLGGVAGHGHLGLDAEHPGYFGRLQLSSEVSALTGACMAMRRSLFEEVGGFSARALQRTFNDMDLCLKVRTRGMLNIFAPRATLIHHESATDGGDIKLKNYERLQREVSYVFENWGFMREDPQYNVNLSLEGQSYVLAFPPRRIKPWEIDKQQT